MQQFSKFKKVFVYLVQSGQENSIPDLDKVREMKGFFPNLTGLFKDMFVDYDDNNDIIFIGDEMLLTEHYEFQYETGIGYAPPEADYVSHNVMVEQDDLHWASGDWVFLLTQHPGNAWSIKGGNYLP